MKNIVLKIDQLSHWFGEKKVLHDINLELLQGQFTALVGPSGCGKSTLFRSILGTHPPCDGSIYISTDRIAYFEKVVRPNRNVGIVYQHYSLYDFLTTEENIAFGPMLDQTNLFHRTFMPWYWWPLRKKHLIEAKDWLKRLDLERAIGHYPSELSGGMRQRVAIAQALVMKPKIILLDEPFGALDEATREDLQMMLLHLYQENLAAKAKGEQPPYTVLMVTHELNEAFYIADRIIGLSQYWEDDKTNGLTVGSTICYDKTCPIFTPDDPRDFTRFADQKEELREVVFSQKLCSPTEHRTYWADRENCLQKRV